jgi:hypothetical protein
MRELQVEASSKMWSCMVYIIASSVKERGPVILSFIKLHRTSIFWAVLDICLVIVMIFRVTGVHCTVSLSVMKSHQCLVMWLQHLNSLHFVYWLVQLSIYNSMQHHTWYLQSRECLMDFSCTPMLFVYTSYHSKLITPVFDSFVM